MSCSGISTLSIFFANSSAVDTLLLFNTAQIRSASSFLPSFSNLSMAFTVLIALSTSWPERSPTFLYHGIYLVLVLLSALTDAPKLALRYFYTALNYLAFAFLLNLFQLLSKPWLPWTSAPPSFLW